MEVTIHERKKKLLLVSNAVLTENFNMTPINHVGVLKGLTRILYQESDGWKNKDINTLRNILFTLDYYVKKEKPGMKILKSEYKGNFVKVLIDFGCGHEPHWITPAKYKSNVGCPKCSTSKGENSVNFH